MKVVRQYRRRNGHTPQTIMTIPIDIAQKLEDVSYVKVNYDEETGIITGNTRGTLNE